MSRIKVTKASVKNMEFLTNISQLVENHERSKKKNKTVLNINKTECDPV